jgi:hypothetical protein
MAKTFRDWNVEQRWLLPPSAIVAPYEHEERLDFMAVTGLNRPDFRTVSDFRKRHLETLQGLFVQVLELRLRREVREAAQAAVDSAAQVIVAQSLSNCATDAQQLAPTLKQINQNTGRQAREFFAGAGARPASTAILSAVSSCLRRAAYV